MACGPGNQEGDPGSAGGGAGDLECAADFGHAFMQVGKAVPVRVPDFRHSAAVVTDLDEESGAAGVDAEPQLAAAGMLDRIVDDLLAVAVQEDVRRF